MIVLNRFPKLDSRRLLMFLVLVFIGLATYYSLTTPILESPDEVWHYQFVREVAVNHGLPVVQPEIKQPFAHEGLQPPLYYTLSAALIAWMNPRDLETLPAPNPYLRIGEPAFASNDNRNAFVHTSDEAFPYHGAALAIHLIRLFSILLGAGTVVFTYLLACEIFSSNASPVMTGEEGVGVLAAAFVAFLPQFLFISGVISNDNLATMLCVAALWQLARMMRRGLSTTRAFVLGLTVGGALLTKLSAGAIAPLALLVLAYLTWQKRAWRMGFKVTAIFGFTVALLAGWWFMRNWQLYGDLFPFTPLAQLVGTRPTNLSFWKWLSAEGEGLRLSTWGVFGWFNILTAPWFYLFYDALAALGLAGIAFALVRRVKLSLRLSLLPLWIVFCFIAFWRYASFIITTQGRLLFPALPAWAILWAWGLSSLVPVRLQAMARLTSTAALCASALFTPALFIAPAYAPTLIAENQLPANMTRLGWRFENGSEWLGATLDRTAVRPGETLIVTIYQRLPAGFDPHTALFIHLVNSADVIVAQRDSLVGAGNWSARPGEAMVADTYCIPIPVTAPVLDATAWRVEAGLYNPGDGRRFRATAVTGQMLGDQLNLATISVEPAALSWRFDFSGQARLVGADYGDQTALAGQTLALTLHWREVNPNSNYHVFVHALGKDEHIWASADMKIDSAGLTKLDLTFDPATPADVYPLELGVYAAPDGDRLAVFDAQGQDQGDRLFLGPIRVTR